ncbi:staphyloferrin B biosynthesis decarboxylase SbnH [Longispora fulva]|uniref:Diaminopimelate decarboxylase n=1 Tax=Longispora fulva TaxID=619741 RepID=A0A8J7GF20_9ACTN|nr:alanine racemase [Longispora fulva]MBG6135352.1 diaminopimelate decarboxylase [Longispora fulva]GIG56410.1 staphyloferrin B biosynthesis decarboxylase SbnH [Longispora fulva]
MIGDAARPVCAYLYDPAVLAGRLEAVRVALPAGAGVFYAVKANSHPAFLAAAAAVADGLEVASGGELAKAVAAGARRVVFGGPAKTDAELRAAVAAGAHVNVESAWELARLDAFADRPVDICLRVNRAASPLDGSHRMTGAPTAFGIDERQLADVVVAARRSRWLRLRGLHLHAVSNNLDAAAHAAYAADCLAYTDAVLPGADVVNIGGGLGVDYTGDRSFDLDAFARLVPPDPRLVVEIGRYAAAPAGRYAAEVLDLKRTHGQWFALLRGGTHHFRLPAAWGYDHPFTVHPVDEWPYDLPRPQVTDVAVTAAGELCTPRDVLCRARHVDRLRVGDVLVFDDTGAYGFEVSHHDFLSHPKPQVLLTSR